jgi:hypothetical protein
VSLTKLVKAALIETVIVGVLALVSGTALSASSRRSVSGTVTDDSGKILEGAVVQLKNRLTLNIRSYITQSDGLYRFHGLHPDIDYEVKAAYQERSSRSRTLSRFNSASNVRIDLKVPNGEARLLEGRTSENPNKRYEEGVRAVASNSRSVLERAAALNGESVMQRSWIRPALIGPRVTSNEHPLTRPCPLRPPRLSWEFRASPSDT